MRAPKALVTALLIILSIPAAFSSDIPASLQQYHAMVTFTPKYSQFTYKIWDSNGHPLPAEPDSPAYLMCDVNGGGNVLNCYCAPDFTPTALGTMRLSSRTALFVESSKANTPFAQFGIPENQHDPISKTVECTRRSH
jgi:hypothetical protein